MQHATYASGQKGDDDHDDDDNDDDDGDVIMIMMSNKKNIPSPLISLLYWLQVYRHVNAACYLSTKLTVGVLHWHCLCSYTNIGQIHR
jgi:hypothetical protein